MTAGATAAGQVALTARPHGGFLRQPAVDGPLEFWKRVVQQARTRFDVLPNSQASDRSLLNRVAEVEHKALPANLSREDIFSELNHPSPQSIRFPASSRMDTAYSKREQQSEPMELVNAPTWSPRKTIRQFVGARFSWGSSSASFRLGMAIEPVAESEEGVVAKTTRFRAATIFTGIAHFTIGLFFSCGPIPERPTRESRKRILAALLTGGRCAPPASPSRASSSPFFLAGFFGLYFLTTKSGTNTSSAGPMATSPTKGPWTNRGHPDHRRRIICVAAAIRGTILFVKRTKQGGDENPPPLDRPGYPRHR